MSGAAGGRVMPAGIALAAVALVLAPACRPADRPRPSGAAANAPAERGTPRRTYPGAPVISQPGQLRAGDTVAGLVVDSVAATWGAGAGEWVGLVRFHGRVRLAGHRVPHFDADVHAVCFEADSQSARRLPRWPDDERRPWFCFSNTAAASRLLGATDTLERVTIVIDSFTTVRAFTDAVNSAWLAELE